MIAAVVCRRFMASSALLAWTFLRVGAASALGFAAPILCPVGNEPHFVAIGDLDEDGRPDLLVTSRYETAISVLLGNADGTWGPRTLLDNGPSYSSYLAAGDVNLDGHVDIVAGSGNDYVSVFFGDGHGNLTRTSMPPAGLYPVSVGIGDLNGDGWPDIVTSNPGTTRCCHSTATLSGIGSGQFASPLKLPGDRDQTDLALADFNEDGALDILQGNEYGYGRLFLGNGDGTFQPAVAFTESNYMFDIDVADMNHDGHADVVIAGWPASALVVLGNGDGTFRPPVAAVAGGSNSVAVADFDGDGNPDVATCQGDSVAIALGSGDGTFGQIVFVPCGAEVFAVEGAEMNGDGKADLIALYGATVAVFLNNGPVAVEAQPRRFRLELSGLRPNPARGDLHAAFTLGGNGRATLELLDLSGRSIRAQEVGSLGPGRHAITFTRDSAIRAGVYWLRLRQGNETRVARAVVLN